jgi:ABC-type branched-subunit amino acid transport system substrate-binding protein
MKCVTRLSARRALHKALFITSFLALTAPHTGQAQSFSTPAGASFNPEVRVGLMVPLSGTLAGVGQSMLHAAQLAVFQQPNDNLRLFPIDSQSGLEAFSTLQSLNVDLVLGPLLAQTVTAIKPEANRSGIPVIAFSSDRTVAGDEVRLISYSPAQQARLMARFAAQEGKTKVAALVPNTPYGQEVLAAFKDEAAKQGLEFLKEVTYDPTEKNMSKPMKTLAKLKPAPSDLQRERNRLEAEFKKQGAGMEPARLQRLRELRRLKTDKAVTFDALFLPCAAESLPLITSQLVYNDMDSNSFYLLGTSLWDNPRSLISKGEYMRNAFFPAAAEGPSTAFRNLYAETYGQQPHPLAILAYDGVMLASASQGRHSFSPNHSYQGASGSFHFNSQNLAEHQYDIVQITPDGFSRYKPAESAPTPEAPTTAPTPPDGQGRWFDRILPRE